MNSCELTASITAIANYLACQLTQEQLEYQAHAVVEAVREMQQGK